MKKIYRKKTLDDYDDLFSEFEEDEEIPDDRYPMW